MTPLTEQTLRDISAARRARLTPDEAREILQELERLRGIVGKFPKTADGVEVTPGMEIFKLGYTGYIFKSVVVGAEWEVYEGEVEDGIPPAEWWIKTKNWSDRAALCYSTREAAEAAKGRA